MNPANLTHKLKSLHFAIEKIWLWELILSAAVLAGLLFTDWWIYRNFVSQREITRQATLSPRQNASISPLLRKNSLENVVKKIRERESFLKNPVFPVF